jgi:chromosome condensin MukBEF ATPase and DNA-binding subunit MukB
MMTNIEREVGKLEARMENVEQELQAIREDVRHIRDALVGLRGGWFALTLMVTVATSMGALIGRYLPLLAEGMK